MEQRTILFVDQADSTRLLAAIGDEAMLIVRQRLWAILNAAVLEHDGRVFSDEGDGGAIVFSDPDAGARAALAIMHGAHDNQIVLRCGLHSGGVVPNGEGFVGMTVHTAARVCAAAPPGHVLTTSDDAATLSSAAVRLTDFGRRILKGIDSPTTVLLLSDPTDEPPDVSELADAVGREPMGSSQLLMQTPGLVVGRSDEIVALERRTSRSADVGVPAVLIAGDAGSGKSTLAHRRCREMVDEGWLCLVGRADEGSDDPFHEIIELLGHLVRVAPLDLLAAHVLRHGDLLTRWIPGLGDRVPSAARPELAEDSRPDRRRLHEAVVDLLDAASRIQPIVMLFEDLHWGTRSSVDVVRRLVLGRTLPGVALIVTYRATEIEPKSGSAELLSATDGLANVEALHLEPLTVAEIEDFVAAQLPKLVEQRAAIGRELALHVARETGGNPLFCAEVLRHLDEDALIAAEPEAVSGLVAIPPTVQDLATRRVDRLGENVASVLTDASVLGEVFTTKDLMHMTADGPGLLDALDSAERVGVLRSHDERGRRFGFGHALIQQALYQRMTTTERLRRHRRAADAVMVGSSKGSRATELLGHLLASGMLAEPAEVAASASRAAAEASERLALRESIEFRRIALDAVLETSDDQAAAADAWLALGRAQTNAGVGSWVESMVQAAACLRTVGDWDGFARIAVAYGGDVKENQAALDVSTPVGLIVEALEHRPHRDELRSRLLMSLALWRRQNTPLADRSAFVDESMSIARELGDDRLLAAVLNERHRSLHGPGAAQLGLDDSRELEAIGIRLNDPLMQFQAVNIRLLASFALGDFALAVRSVDELSVAATHVRNIEGRRMSLMWQTVRAHMRGDSLAADGLVRDVNNLLADYPDDVSHMFMAALNFTSLWMTGQSDVVYQIAPLAANRPGTLAWFGAEIGHERTADHVRDTGGVAGLVGRGDYMWWHDAVGLTRAARYLDDAALASDLYDAMLLYRRHNAVMGLVSFFGAAEHHLGSLARVIGSDDLAVEHFEAAIAAHEMMEAAPYTALSQAELAAVLERRRAPGDADRAAALRSTATSAAETLGAELVLAELATSANLG